MKPIVANLGAHMRAPSGSAIRASLRCPASLTIGTKAVSAATSPPPVVAVPPGKMRGDRVARSPRHRHFSTARLNGLKSDRCAVDLFLLIDTEAVRDVFHVLHERIHRFLSGGR